MTLSLSNLVKSLGPDLIKRAEKLKARECEETESGHFVAFVEEGKNDFDVSINLTPKGLVQSHSCDCEDKLPVCRHKVALLLFLAGGRKSKSAVASKRKESIPEVLLRLADSETLKAWLLEMFGKNKDLELLFINRFQPTGLKLTPEQVKEATVQAAKSLLKNKKKLEQLELKKVLELWEEVHKPIVNQYLDEVSDVGNFQLFHTVLLSVVEITNSWRYTGSKVSKYVERLVKKAFDAILALHNSETKKEAILLFVSEMGKKESSLRYLYMREISERLALFDNEIQTVLIEALMAITNPLQKAGYFGLQDLVVKMLSLVSTGGLFAKYVASFDFIRYENEYNQLLIKELIRIKEFGKAEKICKKAIESNYQESYSLAYYDLLKEIYTGTGNQNGLWQLVEQTLQVTFSFEDFTMLYETMTDVEAKKKYRSKLLAKARSSYTDQGEIFAFELVASEGNFKKMIEYIRSHTPMSLIIKYMEPMAKIGKFELLKAIFERDRDRSQSYRYDEDTSTYPDITTELLTRYDPEDLRLAIASQKSSRSYGFQSNSKLADYIKKDLNL